MRSLIRLATFFAFVALACSSIALAPSARAQQPDEVPYFLVATPDLPDPIFNKSVILVFPTAHQEFIVGLIFNKPTSVPATRLFPGASGLSGDSASAFFGGPVFPEQPSLLIRAAKRPPSSVLLFENVYVCTDPDSIAAILKDPATRDAARLILGRAQWLPRQLVNEIEEGSWLKMPVDSSKIFSTPANQLWDALSKRGSVIEINFRTPK